MNNTHSKKNNTNTATTHCNKVKIPVKIITMITLIFVAVTTMVDTTILSKAGYDSYDAAGVEEAINKPINTTDNVTIDNASYTPRSSTSKDLTFKNPDIISNSKAEYKAALAIGSDSLWKIMNSADNVLGEAQTNPYLIKKDNENNFSIQIGTGKTEETIRVAYTSLDFVDLGGDLIRIPNTSTADNNDYYYVTKKNVQVGYKVTDYDVANYDNKNTVTKLLKNDNGIYTNQEPKKDDYYAYAVTYSKDLNGNYELPKEISIKANANSDSNLKEIDDIIKSSTIENTQFQLQAPLETTEGKEMVAKMNAEKNSQPATTATDTNTGNESNNGTSLAGSIRENFKWLIAGLVFIVVNYSIYAIYRRDNK